MISAYFRNFQHLKCYDSDVTSASGLLKAAAFLLTKEIVCVCVKIFSESFIFPREFFILLPILIPITVNFNFFDDI